MLSQIALHSNFQKAKNRSRRDRDRDRDKSRDREKSRGREKSRDRSAYKDSPVEKEKERKPALQDDDDEIDWHAQLEEIEEQQKAKRR